MKVKYSMEEARRNMNFPSCDTIISMVEPLFYLTQAFAIGIGISDFFPMLRVN